MTLATLNENAIAGAMIKTRIFGLLPNGDHVYAFDLYGGGVDGSGLTATILSYGAILQSLRLPSQQDTGLDVVLGFDDLAGYLGDHPCFGTAIGRIANRTRGASFTVDEQVYTIPANDGLNNLHGGPCGFDRVNWEHEIDGERLILTHISPNGHQGFPGTVTAQIEFTLSGSTLGLDMRARTDQLTPLALTHHSYFNLTDGGASEVSDHELTVMCEHYLERGPDNVPTGRILSMSGSALDYTQAKRAAPDLDDCFVKHHDTDNTRVHKLAKIKSKTTGHMMIICSTQPALQIYSGAHIGDITGKNAAGYRANHGIALEPQNFPNAVNEKSFPSPLIGPEKLYHHSIRYTVKTGP